MTKDQKPDPVNSPAHYTAGAVEMIDYIEQVVATYPSDQAYCIGNAIKYISRAPLKGAHLQDLQKARWYLDRAIGLVEGAPKISGPLPAEAVIKG